MLVLLYGKASGTSLLLSFWAQVSAKRTSFASVFPAKAREGASLPCQWLAERVLPRSESISEVMLPAHNGDGVGSGAGAGKLAVDDPRLNAGTPLNFARGGGINLLAALFADAAAEGAGD